MEKESLYAVEIATTLSKTMNLIDTMSKTLNALTAIQNNPNNSSAKTVRSNLQLITVKYVAFMMERALNFKFFTVNTAILALLEASKTFSTVKIANCVSLSRLKKDITVS